MLRATLAPAIGPYSWEARMNTEDTNVWELLQEQLEGEDGDKLSALVAELPSGQVAQALRERRSPS